MCIDFKNSNAEESAPSAVGAVATSGGSILGVQPSLNWNSKKLVDLFTVLLMLKCISERDFTQPFWFCSMKNWID
jgi:hypothetical protein